VGEGEDVGAVAVGHTVGLNVGRVEREGGCVSRLRPRDAMNAPNERAELDRTGLPRHHAEARGIRPGALP
jgi:hypothetical protein